MKVTSASSRIRYLSHGCTTGAILYPPRLLGPFWRDNDYVITSLYEYEDIDTPEAIVSSPTWPRCEFMNCGTQALSSVFSSVPALYDRVHWMDVLLSFLPSFPSSPWYSASEGRIHFLARKGGDSIHRCGSHFVLCRSTILLRIRGHNSGKRT